MDNVRIVAFYNGFSECVLHILELESREGPSTLTTYLPLSGVTRIGSPARKLKSELSRLQTVQFEV